MTEGKAGAGRKTGEGKLILCVEQKAGEGQVFRGGDLDVVLVSREDVYGDAEAFYDRGVVGEGRVIGLGVGALNVF